MKNYSEISDKIHQYKLIEHAVQLLLRQAHGIEAEKKETDKVIQGLNQWLNEPPPYPPALGLETGPKLPFKTLIEVELKVPICSGSADVLCLCGL